MFARKWQLTLVLVAGSGAMRSATAQVKYELHNEQGASAPCVGIGIGILLAKKCVSAFEKAGFVRDKEIGVSGLTIGDAGAQDAVVTAVLPNSPASQAGMMVGDVLISVDEHPLRPTPAEVLGQRAFGPRGQDLHLRISRNGTEQDLTFPRAPREAPPAPKGEGMLTSERPLINWRGQFAPCIGVQPSAELAFAFCDKHFAPFGFIKRDEFSSPGFQIDAARGDAAIVKAVDSDSPAAKAGLKPGDVVVMLEGQPLTASAGVNARMLLFGKAGQAHKVVFKHGDAVQPATLTLAPKAKGKDEKDDDEKP